MVPLGAAVKVEVRMEVERVGAACALAAKVVAAHRWASPIMEPSVAAVRKAAVATATATAATATSQQLSTSGKVP